MARHCATSGDLAALQSIIQAYHDGLEDDIEDPDDNGKTALAYAYSTGNIACARALEEAGADVHRADIFGFSPFHAMISCNEGVPAVPTVPSEVAATALCVGDNQSPEKKVVHAQRKVATHRK